MRKLLAICGLVLLAGCSDDDLDHDVRYTYGIPGGLYEHATEQCGNANSTVDRIFVTHISGKTDYEPEYDKDGKHVGNQQVNTTDYTFITRCVSGAKFNTKLEFNFDTGDNIDAITSKPSANGSY
ncbi:MAG: hypothetical protein JXR12_05340 [Neptunomonas phycophila]|uniref:hypothetical protein n=1 Tax=Neptunomonas phycophila TaxID=1572645 RepID=UPI003B8D76B5